jgi:molybdopterin-synthase adenylyltransferase
MTSSLVQDIMRVSSMTAFPDGAPYRSISLGQIRRLVEEHGISGKDVEIAALENNIVPERYAGNMKTLTCADQRILLKSRVSVVGQGGLGGMVTEILARVGIGSLNVIDPDIFEDSNLNRQLLCTEDSLFESKARTAVKRIREINGSVDATAHPFFLSESNAPNVLKDSNVVVDCLDCMKTRFTVARSASRLRIPLVSAAIAGTSGHLTTIFPEDPGLESIYGSEALVEDKGAEAVLGCLPQIASLMASLECAEVLKILLDHGTLLRNRLLIVDLNENLFEIIALQASE